MTTPLPPLRDANLRRILRLAGLALTMLATTHVATVFGAVQASLFIDGVQGEGPDGSIALSSFEFLPPHGAQVHIAKLLDATSAQLQQFTVAGTNIPTVTMVVTWTGRSGTVTYVMSNVIFTSFSVNGNSESDTLRWTTITQTESLGTLAVAGQVLDLCTRKPIAGASVTLSAAGTGVASGVTDGRGRFKLDGLLDDEYDLAVIGSGYLDFTTSVIVAGTKNPSAMTIGLTPLVPSDGCN